MELSEAIEILLDFKWRDVEWAKMDEAIETVLQALEETKKQKDQLVELYHQRVQEVIYLKDEKERWRNKMKEKIEEQTIDNVEKSEREKELKKYLDKNEYVTKKEVFEMIDLSKRTYEYGLD